MTRAVRDPLSPPPFPAEVIVHAVWLYLRFSLSLRMVEDLLAARGLTVSHQTVRLWAEKFKRRFANEIRRRSAGKLGDTTGSSTPCDDHRQTRILRNGQTQHHARGRTPFAQGIEQPNREFTSADTTAKAHLEGLRISPTSPAFRLSSRPDCQISSTFHVTTSPPAIIANCAAAINMWAKMVKA